MHLNLNEYSTPNKGIENIFNNNNNNNINNISFVDKKLKEIANKYWYDKANQEIINLHKPLSKVYKQYSDSHLSEKQIFIRLVNQLHDIAKDLDCDVSYPNTNPEKRMEWECNHFKTLAENVKNKSTESSILLDEMLVELKIQPISSEIRRAISKVKLLKKMISSSPYKPHLQQTYNELTSSMSTQKELKTMEIGKMKFLVLYSYQKFKTNNRLDEFFMELGKSDESFDCDFQFLKNFKALYYNKKKSLELVEEMLKEIRSLPLSRERERTKRKIEGLKEIFNDETLGYDKELQAEYNKLSSSTSLKKEMATIDLVSVQKPSFILYMYQKFKAENSLNEFFTELLSEMELEYDFTFLEAFEKLA